MSETTIKPRLTATQRGLLADLRDGQTLCQAGARWFMGHRGYTWAVQRRTAEALLAGGWIEARPGANARSAAYRLTDQAREVVGLEVGAPESELGPAAPSPYLGPTDLQTALRESGLAVSVPDGRYVAYRLEFDDGQEVRSAGVSIRRLHTVSGHGGSVLGTGAWVEEWEVPPTVLWRPG